MFTRQAANIAQALYLGGLPQASVAAAQNLMGQCRAFIEHRGPVRFDYSNPGFKLITPPLAGVAPGGGSGPPPEDFPPTDPGPEEEEAGEDPLRPQRPQDPAPAEHRHPQLPPPAGMGEGEPAVWPGTNSYYEADYIRINKRRRTISVRANDLKRHAAFPLEQNKANTLHSLDFIAETYLDDVLMDPADEATNIALEVQDNRDDTTWTLRVRDLQLQNVLTNVALEYSGGWRLKFTKRPVLVFSPGAIQEIEFLLQQVNCLTDASLGGSSIDFPATKAWVLQTESGTAASLPITDCETP